MVIIKKPQINVGEDVEKREFSYPVGGNVYWYSHCGQQYECFSKPKIEQLYDPAIDFWVYSQKNKSNKTIYLKRYMHPSVHSSTIYNSQAMEATQVSTNSQTILLSQKKKKKWHSIICSNVDEPREFYA